ncbi:MAG: hypothetical protein ACLP0J_27035 [Solirubrobacteraceae bacterium]
MLNDDLCVEAAGVLHQPERSDGTIPENDLGTIAIAPMLRARLHDEQNLALQLDALG